MIILPRAIFDNALFLDSFSPPQQVPTTFALDYRWATQFLLSYQHNTETFKSFRRELERLVQWSWLVANRSILSLKRDDIEQYLTFCQKPPIAWIGTKKTSRFIDDADQRVPNPHWRLFVMTTSKALKKQDTPLNRKQYVLSEKGFREIFTILNCFYNFLIQEDVVEVNPIVQIRQKNRFYRTTQGTIKIRRLSKIQWQAVMQAALSLAEENPVQHERTLFILSILYSLYLRISELTASERWIPKMNDFTKDYEGHWWFTTVGKGNKQRQISVSDAMLEALKRWRKHLKCNTLLPTANDGSPLIPKIRGMGPVTDASHIRHIVQVCFDAAIALLHKKGLVEEAQALAEATVHWLRHTGISDDVQFRPREHVRDDAGHSSSSITDKYIDVERRERHRSARKKVIL